jgi:small subunit ribosomal protein S21
MGNHSNVKVTIDVKGAERAIKKFKRLCESFGVLREYRLRKEYKKPSIRKKEKHEAAVKRVLNNERRMQRQSRSKNI